MSTKVTHGKVLFDITEFVSAPHRTGIQRVTLETALRWPQPGELVPVLFRAGQGFCFLPDSIWETMERYFAADPNQAREAANLLRASADNSRRSLMQRDLESAAAILCTEAFYCEHRVRYYSELLKRYARRVHMVLFDLIPWFHPEYFPQLGSMLGCMPYLRMLRNLQHPMFISEATRQDFRGRFLKNSSCDGPVISLGADSLGNVPPSLEIQPPVFCVIGTIEPRKNHAAVVEGFKLLWKNDSPAKLVFIGRMGCENAFSDDLRKLVENEARFTWVTNAEDQQVKATIRGARASIFPSLCEGFGIPPLESLALGTPVIVSANTPSISMLPELGQIRLAAPTAENIAAAVLQMLDDEFALQKQHEILQLTLPTWPGMVAEIFAAVHHQNLATTQPVAA
jgi:glycosyltransferase involved in cell wall biosynthesis